MIDVFVPVLGRPGNVKPLVASFRAFSDQMDEIYFICSPGDDAQIQACLHSGQLTGVVDFEPGPGDYARKMNWAFSHSERPWIFLGADDIEFSEGWSEKALAQKGDVIATNDLANRQVQRGEFGTHCFVRRTYIEELGASADGPGVLMHEGYDHNFVDRELCGVARNRKAYSFAKDSVVRHRHPLWRTASWDRTYKKGMKHFHADRALYIERAPLWNYAGLSLQEKNLARRRNRDILRLR